MYTGKFYTFVKTYIGAIVKLFFRIKVVGRENIPEKGGYILCCNHTHFMDCITVAASTKRCVHFLAKATKIPCK